MCSANASRCYRFHSRCAQAAVLERLQQGTTDQGLAHASVGAGDEKAACTGNLDCRGLIAHHPRSISNLRSRADTLRGPEVAMFSAETIQTDNKREFYAQLAQQARGLLAGEHDRIANAANLSALVFDAVPDLNWAGFYFFDGRELVVGPFQGKPACVRIAIGRGVCGTAAATGKTQLVEDVHAFAGHIACDAASNAEIVVPMFATDGRLLGVWDVDSPTRARFDDDDRQGMENLVGIYLESISRPSAASAA